MTAQLEGRPHRPGEGAGRLALSGAARGWFLGLAVLLVLPTALLGLQHRDDLEAFHNRVLAPWPGPRTFGRNPAAWFAQANRWLADRAYPIVAAVHSRNSLAYFLFRASPSPNVTVGPRGFVFLNGNDAAHENDLVAGACVAAAEAGTVAAAEGALGQIAAFGSRRGLAADVLVVPTVPVLYGDKLPRSFPPALRAACAAASAGRAPLNRIRAPGGLRFVYPFGELGALRDDPAMFPIGGFHPDGLSVETASRSYLGAIGASVPANLSLTLTSAPSEVLSYYGVSASFPVYVVSGSDAVDDPEITAAVRAAAQPFYDGRVDTDVYRNPAAPNPETVLILSDSYGYNQGVSLSAAFRTVVQTPVPNRDPAALLDAIRAIVPADRLLLVFNDSNIAKVIDIGNRMSAAASR